MPETQNPSNLTAEIAEGLAKVKGLEQLNVMELFQDDADFLRWRDRAVARKLLGSESGQDGPIGPTRSNVLADNITITYPAAKESPPAARSELSGTAKMLIGALLTATGLGGAYGLIFGTPGRSDPPPDPPQVIDTDTRNTIRFEE